MIEFFNKEIGTATQEYGDMQILQDDSTYREWL